MSTLESAIVIDEDDDDDDDEENKHLFTSSLTTDQESAVQTFLQILNVSDRRRAVDQLTRFDFNVERALSHAFDNTSIITTLPVDREIAPQLGRKSTNATLDDDATTVTTMQPSNAATKPFQEPTNEDSEQKEAKPSDKWMKCYQASPIPFVDPDFPPTRKSLDGRKEQIVASGNNNMPIDTQQDHIVLCQCKLKAAARSVQSDGPNYGRFYLCCGRKNNNRRNRAKITSDDTEISIAVPPCNFFQWDTDGSKGAAGYDTQWSKLAWHSFLGPDYVLYRKQMVADHVRQGAVGNCWFLSALSVVAEKPYLVNALFPKGHQANEKGCYQVNLCLDGKWDAIIVDSNLPVVYGGQSEQDGKQSSRAGNKSLAKHDSRGGAALYGGTVIAYPAFCAIPRGQLWPALVEKAYAKAHGSYANLSGGFIAEGLADLTGAPCETVILDLKGSNNHEKEELWVKTLSACEAGFLLGVATSRGGDGLVGGHAYSILDVREIHGSSVGAQSKVTDFFANPQKKKAKLEEKADPRTSEQKSGIRLVRIRNPWGKREWKGAWSVDSEKWTRGLRDQIGDKSWAKDDGTFWMSFEDMLERFHHMDVCKTRKGWVHTSIKGSFHPEEPLSSCPVVYAVDAPQRTWTFISIIQPKKRANTESRYWYCDPQIVVLKRVKNSSGVWECEGSSLRGVSRRNDMDVFLDPSYEYCIFAFACLPRKRRFSQVFRLACYSSAKVKLIPKSREHATLEAPLRSLHHQVLQEPRKLIYRIAPKSILACIQMCGCVYFVALHGCSESTLSLRLTIDIVDGIGLAFGATGDTHMVPPKSQKILLVVMSSGKMSSATHLSFQYISDTIIRERSEGCGDSRVEFGLGATREMSSVGDLVSSSGDGVHSISQRGSDSLDISAWIPQLGAKI